MADIFELFKKISHKETAPFTPEFIIAGLGNPEQKYTFTRHNAGFLALDFISQKLGADVKTLKFRSLTGRAVIGSHSVLLMKPQTYMNRSGEAVKEAADFYKIPPERIYIICDDISMEVGNLRIRQKGSAGGHNGLKSIIYHLGTDVFPRFKIGVGSPADSAEIVNWVLGTVPVAQREGIRLCFERVLPALELMLQGDTEQAMCRYNGKVNA